MNRKRLNPRLWGISPDPRSLRDAGVCCDIETDESRPLEPLIGPVGFAVVFAACVAVVCWLVWSGLSGVAA